jgi:single-strand DNA-binding protein
MAGVNKAIVLGNLGRDPELRHTNSGTPVVTLSVATTRVWADKAGKRVEETEWHRVTAWGKTAEHCGKYLSRGRSVFVEGRLRTSKYEKDGITHWTTEIVADTVQFVGPNQDKKNEDRAPSPYDPGEFVPTPGEVEIPF